MLTYPNINPVALQIGPLKIHWYGLMYVFGFLIAWALAIYRGRSQKPQWEKNAIADLLFYTAIGLVIGGRLGYMIFYDLPNFLSNPLVFFRVWDGGMSFHGGLLGALAAIWLFGRIHHLAFFELTDFLAPLVPIGLGLGRIGNFINGELWGHATSMPWGMVFPNAGNFPRHPSQLYECFLEGFVLFTILWIYSSKPRPRMAISGMFLLWYGIFRLFVEFFRQPDIQLGYLAFGWVTMGQILSLPMILLGLTLIIYAKFKNRKVLSFNN